MFPHRIRLRGPWECQPLEQWDLGADGQLVRRQPDPPRPQRVELPADWGSTLGHDFHGRVAYRRRFGRPSDLGPGESVWLVCEGADACGELWLNGHPLGVVAGYALHAQFDVTVLLEARNEALLIVELPPPLSNGAGPLRPGRERLPGGPIGPVYLEIRAAQFLDHLSLLPGVPAADGRVPLWLSGLVAGERCDDPLEVVVRDSQQELVHAHVTAGQPFPLRGKSAEIPRWLPPQGSRPPLAELHVRLLRGGARLWEAGFQTAWRHVESSSDSRQLYIDDKPLPLPLPRAPLDIATARSSHSTAIGATDAAVGWACEPIERPLYARCDQARTAIVQRMPVAWAAHLAPRLAHHPSIVAWSAPAAELRALPPAWREHGLCGRPWIDWDAAAFGASGGQAPA